MRSLIPRQEFPIHFIENAKLKLSNLKYSWRRARDGQEALANQKTGKETSKEKIKSKGDFKLLELFSRLFGP